MKKAYLAKFAADRVKVKGRIDRGKQLEYEIFHNFDRTRSLSSAVLGKGRHSIRFAFGESPRVLHKGAIETPPDRKTNYYIDQVTGKVRRIETPPSKVLTTEAASAERRKESGGISDFTTWNFFVVEKHGEPGELRVYYSRGRYCFVRMYEVLKTIQYSNIYDRSQCFAFIDRQHCIYWVGTKEFK